MQRISLLHRLHPTSSSSSLLPLSHDEQIVLLLVTTIFPFFVPLLFCVMFPRVVPHLSSVTLVSDSLCSFLAHSGGKRDTCQRAGSICAL